MAQNSWAPTTSTSQREKVKKEKKEKKSRTEEKEKKSAQPISPTRPESLPPHTRAQLYPRNHRRIQEAEKALLRWVSANPLQPSVLRRLLLCRHLNRRPELVAHTPPRSDRHQKPSQPYSSLPSLDKELPSPRRRDGDACADQRPLLAEPLA